MYPQDTQHPTTLRTPRLPIDYFTRPHSYPLHTYVHTYVHTYIQLTPLSLINACYNIEIIETIRSDQPKTTTIIIYENFNCYNRTFLYCIILTTTYQITHIQTKPYPNMNPRNRTLLRQKPYSKTWLNWQFYTIPSFRRHAQYVRFLFQIWS